jgi:hypothetical protein
MDMSGTRYRTWRRRTCLGALGVVLTAFAAAGCGRTGETAPPPNPPPKLPRALAQAWAQQADAVAASLAAGDGCTAETRAVALRSQIIDAVNSRRIARRYLEPLMGAANALPDRIRCNPPVPPAPKPRKEKPPKHGPGHDHHGKHGGH